MDFPKWYSKERVCTLRLRLASGIFRLLVTMIAVVASDAGAQVRIRERVEIGIPQQFATPPRFSSVEFDSLLAQRIRVELSWDNPIVRDVRAYIATHDTAFVIYDSLSPIEYTFHAPGPNRYLIAPQACGPPNPGADVTWTSRVFLDDSLVAELVNAVHITGCCGGYCVFQAVWYDHIPPPHARFAVLAGQDTISSGQSTSLQVIGLDSSDREVWVNPGTLVTCRIQPDTLGRFISVSGDTVALLNNLRYDDARAARFRFLARPVQPASIERAIIEVVQMNDTVKRGRDTVWVENPVEVVFTRPDSSVVYPTYAGHNDAAARRNWIDLELRVISGDSTPVPNYWVKVLRPALVDSGGHSHGGNRPMGKYRYPIGSATASDTVRAQTDSTGRLKFRYVAAQFGGAERMRAQAVNDTTKFDTLSLVTRVPGLELLPESNHYIKIGGTCSHHGPRDDNQHQGCRTPDNNHYAAQLVRDSLPLMAMVWVDSLGQDTLFINDISLPLGGLFDHLATWNGPHATHRMGLDVDVRTELGNRRGVKVRDAQGETVGNTEFEELAKSLGVTLPDIHDDGTSNEHYHLYYRGP